MRMCARSAVLHRESHQAPEVILYMPYIPSQHWHTLSVLLFGDIALSYHTLSGLKAGSVLARSAVIQKEDEEGKVGVKIGKELMKVAGMALKANITRLGPKVLPLSEKLIFAGNYVARKVICRTPHALCTV